MIEFLTTEGRLTVNGDYIVAVLETNAEQSTIRVAHLDRPVLVQEPYAAVLGRIADAISPPPEAITRGGDP